MYHLITTRRSSLSQGAALAGLVLMLAVPAGAAITGPYTADSNTVILYHFDEASGDIVNAGSLGTTFNLTNTGGATGRGGGGGGYGATAYTGFGNAFNVYNSGDGAYSGTMNDSTAGGAGTSVSQAQSDYNGPNGELTVEALVKLPDISNNRVIINRDGATRGFNLYVSSGEVRFYPGHTGDFTSTIPTEGPNAFVAGEWFHVAATYSGFADEGGNLKLYWTRVTPSNTVANLIGVHTVGGDANGNANQLYVGTQGRSPYRYQPQFVDEVRISNCARSADEFIFAPETPLAPSPYPDGGDSDTAVLYHFDEAGGASDPGNPIVNYGSLGTGYNLTNTGGPDGRDNTGAATGGYGATAFIGFGSAFDIYNSGNGTWYTGNPGQTDGGGVNTSNSGQSQTDYQGANGEFTLEALVNLPETSKEQVIISRDNSSNDGHRGFNFEITGGKVSFWGGNNSSTVATTIPTSGKHAFVAGEWYHVAFTFDGNVGAAGNVKTYWTRLDATNSVANLIGVGTLSLAVNPGLDNTDLHVGGLARAPYRLQAQYVDEVRVSTVVREADEFVFPKFGAFFGLLDDESTAITNRDTYAFGAVPASSNIFRTFTIKNSGDRTLELADPAITIGGDAAFQITANVENAATSILPGETTTFTIRFNGSEGSYSATVTNTFADDSTFTFDVTADAQAAQPIIRVLGQGNEIPSGRTTVSGSDGTDFGSVTSPVTVTHEFVITNIHATETLTLTDGLPSPVALTGGNGTFVISTNADSASLAPGETTSFWVAFTPSPCVRGSYTATLSVASSDIISDPYTFTVVGNCEPGLPAGIGLRIVFTNFVGKGTLTDFPALVKLSTAMPAFSYDYFLDPHGYDLRFWTNSAATGTALNYEIEKWDRSGTSYVWVQVPELTQGAAIWATWGDEADRDRQASTTNGAVWDSGYSMVWHMVDPNQADATDKGNDEVTGGGAPAVESAVIGNGLHFDGSSDWMQANNTIQQDITISVWAKTDGDSGSWNPWLGRAFVGGEWASSYPTAKDMYFTYNNNVVQWYCLDHSVQSATALNDSQWHHLVATRKQSTGLLEVFVDGVREDDYTSSRHDDVSSPPTLGIGNAKGDGSSTYYEGLMDEVRFSQTVRSSNWVWACWMNQGANHDAFAEYTASDTIGAPSINVTNGATAVTESSAWLQAALTSTGDAPTAVWSYWGKSDSGTVSNAWASTNSFGVNALAAPVAYSNAATGLEPNTTYYYRFRAVNASGAKWSEVATFNTVGGPAFALYGQGVAITNGDTTPTPIDGTDFGLVTVTTDAEHVFVISNLASATENLVLTGGYPVTISGGTGFSVSTNVASTDLAPGESTTFAIRYAPYTAGAEQATVSVTSSDMARSPYAFTVQAAADWPALTGRSLRIVFTNFVGRGTLTNFPALVKLSDDVPGFGYDYFLDAGGYDLRFWTNAEMAGTELNYEIENWNRFGTSYVWVQVPVLTQGTAIWASWGDAADHDQRAYTTNGDAWASSFAAVWHMTEPSVVDSVAAGHDGTANGNVNGVGMIGVGQSFDGNDSITVANNYSLADVSVSFWLKTNDISTKAILNKFAGTGDGWGPRCDTDLFIYRDIDNSDADLYRSALSVLSSAEWHYGVAVMHDLGGSFDQKLYLDGALIGSGSTFGAGWNSFSGSFYMGQRGNNQFYFRGVLDEVRLSNVERSSNWVWACWMNQGTGHDAFAQYTVSLQAKQRATLFMFR